MIQSWGGGDVALECPSCCTPSTSVSLALSPATVGSLVKPLPGQLERLMNINSLIINFHLVTRLSEELLVSFCFDCCYPQHSLSHCLSLGVCVCVSVACGRLLHEFRNTTFCWLRAVCHVVTRLVVRYLTLLENDINVELRATGKK